MAEAGWPLRIETFYYTHRRRSGDRFIRCAREIDRILPRATHEDYVHLAQSRWVPVSRPQSPPPKGAVNDSRTRQKALTVHALPRGTWFFPRPVFFCHGALRARILARTARAALSYRLRRSRATGARRSRRDLTPDLRCRARDRPRDARCRGRATPRSSRPDQGYFQRVKAAADELIAIVDDPSRLFESDCARGDLRESAPHRARACKAAGLRRQATSSVRSSA